MADVSRQEYLTVLLTPDDAFPVGEMAFLQVTINKNVILAFSQPDPFTVCNTKTPSFLIIRNHIRDGIRLVFQAIEVLLQLRKGHPTVNGDRVPYNM